MQKFSFRFRLPTSNKGGFSKQKLPVPGFRLEEAKESRPGQASLAVCPRKRAPGAMGHP